MENNCIQFVLNNQLVTIDFEKENLKPSTTVLNYLRSLPNHKGVKEGCAEGDCGACTVVIAELNSKGELHYKAINSCLVFLPQIHGKQLITVENLAQKKGNEYALHPVQQLMIENYGSQCGYCTPGIIMSLFSLYKEHQNASEETITDGLAGNLCRCTGYQAIKNAALKICKAGNNDQFTKNEKEISALLKRIDISKTLVLKGEGQIYFKPFVLQEILSLKTTHPDALLIAGSTDVALRQSKKFEFLPKIIDISQVAELKMISQNNKKLHIGAAVTMEELKRVAQQNLPQLYQILCYFGSKQIRNMATIGGNLGSCSPIGDSIPVLMAFKTLVNVVGKNGKRSISIFDFIKGYRKTDLQPDEIIESITIPLIDEKTIIKSYKISKRKDLDISTVSASFRLEKNKDLTINEIILAYGGMAATPLRATKTEAFLLGKKYDIATVQAAMKILHDEFSPIADARASDKGRRLMAKNLLMKFYADCNQLQ